MRQLSHYETQVKPQNRKPKDVSEEGIMLEQQPAATSAVFAMPGTGKMISLGGTLHTFKLVGADTGGQFALMEGIIQPHSLIVPHIHPQYDELGIGLEGEAGIRVGDQEFHLGPGSYVFIPRGTLHAVWNAT